MSLLYYAYGLSNITVVSPIHLQQKLDQEELVRIAENIMYQSWVPVSLLRKLQ